MSNFKALTHRVVAAYPEADNTMSLNTHSAWPSFAEARNARQIANEKAEQLGIKTRYEIHEIEKDEMEDSEV